MNNCHFNSTWAATFCLLAILLLPGCSDSSSSDQPDLGQVTGVITLDGEPLEGATVTFTPESGRPSTAITDESGSYTLNYIREINGAVFGNHRVTISKMIDLPIEKENPTPEDLEVGNKQESIPGKYNSVSTLTAVVETGENEINFDLVSE